MGKENQRKDFFPCMQLKEKLKETPGEIYEAINILKKLLSLKSYLLTFLPPETFTLSKIFTQRTVERDLF